MKMNYFSYLIQHPSGHFAVLLSLPGCSSGLLMNGHGSVLAVVLQSAVVLIDAHGQGLLRLLLADHETIQVFHYLQCYSL